MQDIDYIVVLLVVLCAIQFATAKAPCLEFAIATKFEWRRRFQHSLTGITLACAGSRIGSVGCAIAALALSVLHIVNGRFPRVASFYRAHVGTLLRSHEHLGSRPTAIDFMLGAAIVFIMMPDETLARIAILHVALGDPAAALIGSSWQQRFPLRKASDETSARLRKVKSWAGFIGAFLVCLITSLYALFIWKSASVERCWASSWKRIIIAIVGALAASLSEMFGGRFMGLDDNLLIQLSSAAVQWLFGAILTNNYGTCFNSSTRVNWFSF